MADPAEVIAPAVAVNVALVALAGIITDVGTVRVGLFEASVTLSLPVVSACARVTVQDVLAPDPKLLDAHCKEDSVTGAWRVMVAAVEAP